SLLALALPLAAGLGAGDTGRTLLGLGIAVFVNLMAQIWLALARGHRRLHWLPYATGTYDISLVTALLGLQAMIDAPASLNGVGARGAAPRRTAGALPGQPGDRALRAAGCRGAGAGAGAAAVDRPWRGHRRRPGHAPGAAGAGDRAHRRAGVPDAAVGGDVRTRQPDRRAQPRLAHAAVAAHVRGRAPRRAHGHHRPGRHGPLQARVRG